MAARLAIAIENSFGVKPVLVAGTDGVFDVAVDGRVVFSKHATGELADTSDIVELVRTHVLELSLR